MPSRKHAGSARVPTIHACSLGGSTTVIIQYFNTSILAPYKIRFSIENSSILNRTSKSPVTHMCNMGWRAFTAEKRWPPALLPASSYLQAEDSGYLLWWCFSYFSVIPTRFCSVVQSEFDWTRRPMPSWGALGRVWPVGRGRFSFHSTLP